MLDMVSAKYGNTLVPLYDSHGPKNVEFCLKHTNLTTAFIVTAKVKTMCQCEELGALKNIVLIEEHTKEDVEALEKKGYKVYTW